MSDRDELDALRTAKRDLIERYRSQPWFRGAGIGATASGPVLRLNVDPEVSAAEGEEVPESFADYPLQVVYLRGYERRGPKPAPAAGKPDEEEG